MRAVTYSRQPMAGRQAAVEHMIAEDADRFWAECAAKARQIDDWPMIRLLSGIAEQAREPRALVWLVRSWAMPSSTVSDVERPERRAIEAITGEKASVLLNAIVFEQAESHPPATQVAAWAVLCRIASHDELRGLVRQAVGGQASLLVSMLKQCEPAVDVLPADREAIARLMRLTAEHDALRWSGWAQWRRSHADDGPATLALRHLPGLLHHDVQAEGWGRARWLEHIRGRLSDRRHVPRGEGAEGAAVVTKRPGRFEDHLDRLGIADLIVLDHLLDAMDDWAVRDSLFEHAEADHNDRRTEFGGALVWDDQGKLIYQPFDPLLRRHDQAYLATARCMQAVYLGLAHVHFHAQRYGNAPWAGPGKGDLDFVDAHHANAVVFTFVDHRTMNADAYWSGGVIIDLGCVTR
ncbi:MAG: hypothetical protein KTR15_06070 [Phycisphaeraceae bacterium]|nr:hypothetical protein [Phycisphaeraceae bacterium]